MTDAAQETKTPTFTLDKIYLKDLSLEIPHAPQIFLQRDDLQTEVQLHTQASTIQKNLFEVVVMVTVTAKVSEKVLFLIEAKQAGIFNIGNVPTEEMGPILAVMCPNILFPYLRAVISDVSVRAGFAPALLNPINFEDMYKQRHQASEAASMTTH